MFQLSCGYWIRKNSTDIKSQIIDSNHATYWHQPSPLTFRSQPRRKRNEKFNAMCCHSGLHPRLILDRSFSTTSRTLTSKGFMMDPAKIWELLAKCNRCCSGLNDDKNVSNVKQTPNSMDYSNSTETNSISASPGIPRILWNPPLKKFGGLSLSWTRSITFRPSRPTSGRSFSILSSLQHPGFPSGLLSSDFPTKTLLCSSHSSHTCYMTRPSNSS